MVSEVMLQQTQVARVLQRWQPFLDRFPTPAACAEASQAEIVTWWEGMGFNRRAVNLRKAARKIVTEHAGVVPNTRLELLALPGIGAYTARAVLVFAYGQPFGVLDTNVARILARTENQTLSRRAGQEGADRLASKAAGHDPWLWNQALLDIGAAHCRPNPRCDGCPLMEVCQWHLGGCQEPDPTLGSAGVSITQSRFEGSDRQGRGLLISALRKGSVPVEQLAMVMGWPNDRDRAERVAAVMIEEGLVSRYRGRYELA